MFMREFQSTDLVHIDSFVYGESDSSLKKFVCDLFMGDVA